MSRTVLPGFSLTIGYTVVVLSLLVLIPLATIALRTANVSWDEFVRTALAPRALASYRLSFGAALVASTINAVFGLLIAWVLVRYRFPGRRFIDTVIDLPFALPTAIGGIALATVYSPTGWLGRGLAHFGVRGAFSPLGVVIALTFVGLPYVVRTVQPVLQSLEPGLEDAAATLGAGRWQTFHRVVLPHLRLAILTGAALAFARAVGEYGSVVFIAGNLPMKTEITPLLIMAKLEQFDEAGANVLAAVMLITSFLLLLAINGLQRRLR